MFGGNRRKALKTALAAVQPLLRTFQLCGNELPKDFWQDPPSYVLVISLPPVLWVRGR